jgi:heme o synthase
MDKAAPLSTFSGVTRAYCLLTKPGILLGNSIPAIGGFALASKGHIAMGLLSATLIGLCLVMASACVFNNYIDRALDAKMTRTKDRALASGVISERGALIFALLLGILGTLFLLRFTNLLAAGAALFGFFVYVILYSFVKYHSVHGTLIGSFAGASPPVVGYCAVSGHFDVGALILFAMVALWQMPHFFAIAIYRLEDYSAGEIPVLPLKKGMFATKMHMLLYIIAFSGVSSLLVVFGYVGSLYLIVAALLGAGWLFLCIKGIRRGEDKLWARKMFFFSLLVITGLFAAIPFSIRTF